MKSSTARKIVKIYQVTGLVLVTFLFGGGLVALLIVLMIQDWKQTLSVIGVIVLFIALLWLYICADVDKDKQD